ncbi:MAG: hypothetical protein B7Z66_06455 [Chromatiales bacterium 21-64-14]|nr:MAG: hypothetical protein B7Z66_06455 [Chromatiales bacterium 21-64-14]
MDFSFGSLAFTTGHYLWEFAEVAVLGFFAAGLLQAVVRPDALRRLVGGGALRSNLAGATAGFLTPLCCCTAIPTAIELYRATGRRGPACAFLIATPWFNWYGLIALAVFLGWPLAGAIAGCGVMIGTMTGLLVDLLGSPARSAVSAAVTVPEVPTTQGSETSCGCTSCEIPPPGGTERWVDFSHPRDKLRQALGTAYGLLRELAPWILAGAVLGALVKEFLPADWVMRYGAGASIAGVALAVAVASVLYTDSLGSLPWIHALQVKGLGAGNAMLLLVAGVGTNVATLGPVGRRMGTRTAVVYAGGVVVTAVLLALVLNRLF